MDKFPENVSVHTGGGGPSFKKMKAQQQGHKYYAGDVYLTFEQPTIAILFVFLSAFGLSTQINLDIYI